MKFRRDLTKTAVAIFALCISCPAYAYEAPIEYILARNYYETALREIDQAQESIKVYMFVISANPKEPESKVMRLLDALVAAKGRGAAVEVHLDQNYAYGSDRQEVEEKSENACQYLKQGGIPVYFDDPSSYAHAKAVVIDERVAIFGSSNWSRSAFDINDETNAIVRSEQFAKEMLEDLSRVENLVPDLPEEIKGIRIPATFTTSEDLMGEMVTSQEERAYDIYLYLLKSFDGNKDRKITVDYDDLAKSLGIDGMTRTEYRRQISKVLRKLQSDYNLIAVDIILNEPAQVVLKEVAGEDTISLPESYWTAGWNRRLTFAGKVMLLLNWQYSNGTFNNWRKSMNDLMKTHHMSRIFIGDGVQELRRLNLVDVRYDDVSPEDSQGPRWRATYSPNQIYDPEALNKQFGELNEKYGKEAVDRAKSYARVVYKENDYEDVLTLIGLESKYGQEVLKEAVGVLEAKAATNPKRHFGYLVGTVKGIAKERV